MTAGVKRFGAIPQADGVRFGLWAPAARRVDLCLGDGDGPVTLAMEPTEGGWFGLSTDRAGAGTRYRYRIDGDMLVPDPASRCQPDDVHGPSQVPDPGAYLWNNPDWAGRPWAEAVVYELHVGTFTPAGTFEGVRGKLDHLAGLGVTAVELMPVADFPGRRNWGYDGVYPFAPDSSYGTPDDLKRLIDDAHGRGLMMFLDVVYNHFGPDGNYLHACAPQFFTERHHTPWGAAIDFSRREVRNFVIENALYWLQDFRFDGLRLDAVHAILDDSSPHILEELADTVRERIGPERRVHLILENEANTARYLGREGDGGPRFYTAQWNDDIHHACHVLATEESDAYYADFADAPLAHLARCLVEGFAYQGEPSRHAGGRPRGEPSTHLPPDAFVTFLQNHDQIGNRAFGERLGALAAPEAVRALRAIVLMAPSPPLLFMGEEWCAPEPFLFFSDFGDDLADKVREGRRREFARFPAFRDPAVRETIPDPNAEETFLRARLDWGHLSEPVHEEWLAGCRELLHLRRREIVPRLSGMTGGTASARLFGERGLTVTWRLGDGATLGLVANLSDREEDRPALPGGHLLYAVGVVPDRVKSEDPLPPWSVAWFLEP